MGEDAKPNRKRNTALVLIGAGLLLLLERMIGFFPILSMLLIALGIEKVRSQSRRNGFLLVGIGVVMLTSYSFPIVIAIALIAAGYLYMKSRPVQWDESYLQKQTLAESIRWGKESWVPQNSAIRHIVGEAHIDFSLAIWERKETTIILQGAVGDINVVVPEDMGVSVTASLLFGQVRVAQEKEAGIMNKLIWQSPNFHLCDHRVKLVISYLVGDIDVKVL